MPREPFELKIPPEVREKLALWLSNEIDHGQNAKASADNEVDYWHMLYEQARTRSTKNLPWPDAADLTSYLATVFVDSILARMMRTVWTEPVCTVAGYGPSASNADFVEEFHQWKAEEERLQTVLYKIAQVGLIEPRGLLEVYEGSEYRTTRKRVMAQIQTDELTGGMVVNEEGEPVPVRDAEGLIKEQTDPMSAAAEVLVDSTENQRVGPQYRIIPYKDSVILPGHAREKDEIWAYGKRLWKRHTDLVALSQGPRAIYDKDAVDSLTQTGDRETDASLERSNMTVAPQDETTAEKELWEVLLLLDLKMFCETWSLKTPKGTGSGARWYLITIAKASSKPVILRIQHDDLERSRFVNFILHPRSERATEGYSFVGHKLITTVEEHTAYRNMAADRSSMANSAPVMRQQGALWDPIEQPWGPKAVIDVRDPRELTQVQVQDVPASIFTHIQMQETIAERLSGVNDVASGASGGTGDSTLGELQMRTEQSFVRMDLIIRCFQEGIEDLYQIRHAIWKRVLAEKKDGVDAPKSLMVGLEGRGVPIDQFMPDQKVTAALLDGAFRFKPHGSVETADLGKQRSDYVQSMQFFPQLLQTAQMMASMFGPQAAKAVLRQWVKLFRIPNPQAFLGSPAADVMQQQGMAPGAPPGAPPPAGVPPPMGPPAPMGPLGAPPAPPLGGPQQ